MKITYVITRAEMGGAQVHVLDLLKGFAGQHTLSVVTGERGYLTEECERLGVEYHVVPTLVQPLQPWQDLKAIGGVAAALRRIRPALVHCHTSKAGLVGRVAARLCGIPSVFTAHTWSFADGTSRLWKAVGKPAERLSSTLSRKIITVSDSNRKLAIQLGVTPPNKVVTIYNGIEDRPWPLRDHDATTGDVPEIVMVARFANQKNQAELVEAVAGIELPFHVSFVGDGPTRAALEDDVKTRGLGSRISFLGLRKDTDLILNRASIFVLATKWEGFPLTILEAMRACLPVVATDVDGIAEAVRHGETGILYQRGQASELRNALTALLESPALRRKMGMAGRRFYESSFTREAMLVRTERVYREILASSDASNTAAVESQAAVLARRAVGGQ